MTLKDRPTFENKLVWYLPDSYPDVIGREDDFKCHNKKRGSANVEDDVAGICGRPNLPRLPRRWARCTQSPGMFPPSRARRKCSKHQAVALPLKKRGLAKCVEGCFERFLPGGGPVDVDTLYEQTVRGVISARRWTC